MMSGTILERPRSLRILSHKSEDPLDPLDLLESLELLELLDDRSEL